MCHGGKIAMLGIPTEEIAIDWNTVVFNMLTIKGIYGREMYETWYKMTVMLQSGLDISPVITHRFHYTDFEKGFDAMRSGNSGKVVLTGTTRCSREPDVQQKRGGPMSDSITKHFRQQLDEIRATGLFKAERVITTPQTRTSAWGTDSRC